MKKNKGNIARPPRVEAIVDRVLEKHGVSRTALFSPLKSQKVSRCRNEIFAALFEEIRVQGNPPSLPQIGKWLDRHHTSVLAGLRRHYSGYDWSKHKEPYRPEYVTAAEHHRAHRIESLGRREAWSVEVPRVPVNEWPGRLTERGVGA